MLRQLLTALAILTGLASAGAPAQASANEIASVRLVAAAEQAAVPTAAIGDPALAPRPLVSNGAVAPGLKPRSAVILPAVVLKADRALE